MPENIFSRLSLKTQTGKLQKQETVNAYPIPFTWLRFYVSGLA